MIEVQPSQSDATESSRQELWVANNDFDEKIGFTVFDLQIVDERADLFEEPPVQLCLESSMYSIFQLH